LWLTSHAKFPETNHSLPARLVCGTNPSANVPNLRSNLQKFTGWTRAALSPWPALHGTTGKPNTPHVLYVTPPYKWLYLPQQFTRQDTQACWRHQQKRQLEMHELVGNLACSASIFESPVQLWEDSSGCSCSDATFKSSQTYLVVKVMYLPSSF
jgi:hypothetical protein